MYSDLVDRLRDELRTGNHVVQRGDTVLFVASPDSVRELRDPASAVSRELAAVTAPGRDLIVLRLPGVDDADCVPLRPSTTVVAGSNSLSAATLRALDEVTTSRPLSLDDVLEELAIDPATTPADPEVLRTTLVAVLRHIAREGPAVADIRPLWPLLRATLTSHDTVNRSAQGFYTRVLHSRVEHGRIRELIRLHFWPDEEEPNPFAIHSHQPHATSWVLSGAFLNSVYRVVPTSSPSGNNLFAVRWDSSADYDPRHKVSTVANTGQAVSVEFDCSATFVGGQSYSVPAGEFHSSRSTATELSFAATLFFFDATKGWLDDAPVVGPDHLATAALRRETAVASHDFLSPLDALLL